MPSFLARLLGLPFRPDYWRDSPDYAFFPLFLSLFAVIVIASLAKGCAQAAELGSSLQRMASRLELTADPLVLEQGRIRILGSRTFQMTDGTLTLLLDPESTVPESALTSRDWAAVRSDRVVVHLFGQTTVHDDLAGLSEGKRVVIDSAYLRWFADQILPMFFVLLYLRDAAFPLAGAFVVVLIGAALILLLRGRHAGLGYADCLKIATATSCAAAVVDTSVLLLGVELPGRAFLWLALIAGLGLVGVTLRAPLGARD